MTERILCVHNLVLPPPFFPWSWTIFPPRLWFVFFFLFSMAWEEVVDTLVIGMRCMFMA